MHLIPWGCRWLPMWSPVNTPMTRSICLVSSASTVAAAIAKCGTLGGVCCTGWNTSVFREDVRAYEDICRQIGWPKPRNKSRRSTVVAVVANVCTLASGGQRGSVIKSRAFYGCAMPSAPQHGRFVWGAPGSCRGRASPRWKSRWMRRRSGWLRAWAGVSTARINRWPTLDRRCWPIAMNICLGQAPAVVAPHVRAARRPCHRSGC